ncbi:MAG: PspC domain-containing protein [Chloroflexota bacterium]
MFRSFTDRLFGGVCGGMAAPLPVSSWAVRILFVALTIATSGAFAVLYLMLWLLIPQESLVIRREGGAVWSFVTLLLFVLVTAAWIARINGITQLPAGGDLYYPLLALLLSLVFFIKQIRRTA